MFMLLNGPGFQKHFNNHVYAVKMDRAFQKHCNKHVYAIKMDRGYTKAFWTC